MWFLCRRGLQNRKPAMHEMSLVQTLLDQIAATVQASGHAGRVQTVELIVGRLSGVHVEALRFAFEVLAPSSIAAGAELRIEQPCAVIACRDCGLRNEVIDMTMNCPACGSGQIAIEGGRELLLQSLELAEL
jgi:hydrogenase nickel incorporation protein HypA/HybF